MIFHWNLFSDASNDPDLKSPGYNRAIIGADGLRLNESIGFRCALDKVQNITAPLVKPVITPLAFVRNRLSQVVIKSIPKIEDVVPNPSSMDNFLIKNETKYLSVIKQNSNSEEFNSIASTHDPHMTVVLTWKAIVSDNNSTQRIAYGQSYVQLRHLYDT